jgi:hypothetical protein
MCNRMNKIYKKVCYISFFGVFFLSQVMGQEASAQTAFTPGNLVVYRLGDGITALVSSGSQAFLDEYTQSGTLVQSVAIPITGTARILISGTASSEGFLSLSQDSTLLMNAGYDAAAGGSTGLSSTTVPTVPRVSDTINILGNVGRAVSTSLYFGSNNIRSGVKGTGNDYWDGGPAGVYYMGYNATAVQVTSTNARVVKIFNGNLYFSSNSGTQGIYQFTGTPTSGSATLLVATNTLGGGSSPFCFSVNAAGNIMYVADDAGGISKYVQVLGVWARAYTYTLYPSRGLTVDWSGTFPVIYAITTSGTGALLKLTDNGTVLTSTAVTLASGASGTGFRDVEFAPMCILPSIAPSGSTTICAGSSVTLNAATIITSGLTYTWKNGSGTTVSSASSYSANAAGNYTVTVANAYCSKTSAATTIAITPVVGTPVFTPGPASSRCQGIATTTYTATAPNSTSIAYSLDATSAAYPGNGIVLATGAVTYAAGWSGTTTITATAAGCGATITTATFAVTVKPLPAQPSLFTTSSTSVCPGQNNVTYTIPNDATVTYSWTYTGSGTAITPSGNSASVNFSSAATSGSIQVIAAANNGCGSSATQSVAVTVNPLPVVSAAPAAPLVCNSTTGGGITFSSTVGSTTYAWTNNAANIGLGASGIGNINAFSAINTGTAPVIASISVTPTANGCAGLPLNTTITVNPTPAITAPSSPVPVCNNATGSVVFGSNVTGATYAWTNNTTSSGIATLGLGNISFTAINTSATSINATITVTPTANGCVGLPTPITVIVNPTPVATATPIAPVVCDGTTSGATAFSSTVTGATYTWTNSNTATGLAATGSGNINAFSATNMGTIPITGNIAITPTANGCAGSALNTTVTVNPTPTTVVSLASQAVCNGSTTTAVNFTGPVTGTVFNWTNNTTSVGLLSAGAGNIGSFMANNITAAPVTATISIIPTANGCTGATQTAIITVNPSPVLTITNQTQSRCNGTATAAISFGSSVTGTNYTWTNSTTSIGLAGTGSGATISGFNANNTSTSPITASIIVIPASSLNCVGATQTATITVNPTPVVTATPTAPVVCNGTTGGAIAFSSTIVGTTYIWTNNTTSIGLSATGTGNITAFPATNTGNTPVVAAIGITPTANACAGTVLNANIIVNPTPVLTTTPALQSICNGANSTAVTFASNITGTTYAWANNNTSTGLAASGITTIPVFAGFNSDTAPVTSTISVTPTASSCIGTVQIVLITVNPTPIVTISQPTQTKCNNTATLPINFTSNIAGTTYAWTNNTTTIGLASTGITNIVSFTAANTSNTAATANINVIPTANLCPGTMQGATIIVNPTPSVTILTPTAPQAVCNGAQTGFISFGNSAVAGTLYNWTNDNTFIGLLPVGIGNINSFSAMNPNTAPVVANITVTPSAAGCLGSPQSISITVNPTPMVITSLPAQAICNGATTQIVVFGSNVAGAIFSWANNTPSAGLAANGTGNVNPFTAINTSTAPIIDSIITTPTANGCTGSTAYSTITVYATPVVTAIPASQGGCTNTTDSIKFSSAVAGTTYTWTNNTPAIGLVASGTGNVGFTSANPGNTPLTGIITVIPTANNCAGLPQTATVTVNPLPIVINTPATQAGCVGIASTPVTFTGTVNGTTYAWTNNNTATGLSAANTGNIASFITTNTTSFPITSNILVTAFANGCAGVAIPVTITVNPYPPAVINASANTNSCANDSITLNANSATGYTYQWKGNGLIIPNAINPVYYAHTAGSYTVAITSLGCTTQSSPVPVTIKFIPPAPIYNAGGTLTFCPHDSVILGTATNFPAYTYQWQQNGTNIAGATNSTFTDTAAGSYDVKVNNNGCTNTSAVIITTLNAAPASKNITASYIAVCPGGMDTLSINADDNSLQYQWYRNNILVPGATGGKYSATVAASYTVGITNAAGCTIFSPADNVGAAQNPVPVITYNSKQLCTQSTFATWQWYLNGVAISGATNSCINPGVNTGGYTVLVTSAGSCTGYSAPYYFNTGVNSIAAEPVKLYPNPATSIVNVCAAGKVNVAISGMDGKQFIFVENAATVDISKLPNAVYLIKVYDAENTLLKVEKLVKAGW